LPDYLVSLLLDEGYQLAIVAPHGELEHYRRDIAGLVAAYGKSPGMCLDVVAFPENSGMVPSR
jgi:hypothetical protein